MADESSERGAQELSMAVSSNVIQRKCRVRFER